MVPGRTGRMTLRSEARSTSSNVLSVIRWSSAFRGRRRQRGRSGRFTCPALRIKAQLRRLAYPRVKLTNFNRGLPETLATPRCLSRYRRARNSTARALRALSLVRAQVPILRFQLVHAARRARRAALRRGTAARSRSAGAGGGGAGGALHLSRRRHTEPVFAPRRRVPPGVRARAPGTRRRPRGDPGGEPRNDRAWPVRGI